MISFREKRAASDQRIAELQALIALSKGAHGTLGHGQVDPFEACVGISVSPTL